MEHEKEQHAYHYYHHNEPSGSSSEGDNMQSGFTNPALPVTVSGGDFGHNGFEPADAALVQSNNLAILGTQINFGMQMLQNTICQNSKDDALLAKDGIIATMNMQNQNMMMFMQMNSKLDHIACCTCNGTPAPTRG